jgi:hypothetical protein
MHGDDAPPPAASPLRQRAMTQLRPVSVPAVIKDMAGKNLAQTLQDFDRHYMPKLPYSMAMM